MSSSSTDGPWARHSRYALPAGAGLVFLAAWEWAVAAWNVPKFVLPAPSLIAAYQAGDHAAMSRQLLGVLDYLRDTTYQSLDARTVHALNAFAKHFLYFFTQEDYSPADADLAGFVARNAVIAGVAVAPLWNRLPPRPGR